MVGVAQWLEVWGKSRTRAGDIVLCYAYAGIRYDGAGCVPVDRGSPATSPPRAGNNNRRDLHHRADVPIQAAMVGSYAEQLAAGERGRLQVGCNPITRKRRWAVEQVPSPGRDSRGRQSY